MIEVLVPSMQNKIVLQDQRSQPDVVCRNGGSLLSELTEHRGVVMGRLVIGEEDFDTLFQ